MAIIPPDAPSSKRAKTIRNKELVEAMTKKERNDPQSDKRSICFLPNLSDKYPSKGLATICAKG